MGLPYIYTFYSFKGGVGRSMALLNVAYDLCSRGRQVLVVDMDLEAPGVSAFLRRNGELGESRPSADVIDLLAGAIADARVEGTVGEGGHPRSRDAVVSSVPADKRSPLLPRHGELGRVDVIGIDLDREYFERLSALDLAGLSRSEIVDVGQRLRDCLKRWRIPVVDFDEEGKEIQVQAPYDYVLVDSRTGVTEIGGLCIGPLSDRLVVLTSLNDQNVSGTSRLLSEVGISERRENSEAPWDEGDVPPSAPNAPPRLGPKPTLLVASPVPSGEIEYKRKRLKELEDSLGPIAVKLSYHPQMALMESIFVRDYPDEYLADEYRSLTKSVMAAVQDEPEQIGMTLLFGQSKLELGQEEWTERLRRLALYPGPFAESVLSHMLFAKFATARGLAILRRPIERDGVALRRQGDQLSHLAARRDDVLPDLLYAAAFDRYERALALDAEDRNALRAWARTLSAQARSKSGEESDRLFRESNDKFERTVNMGGRVHLTLHKWGLELAQRAKRRHGSEREQLFADSLEKLRAAEELQSGSGAYDIACVFALRGDAAQCRDWLEKAIATGKVTRQQVIDDEDLAGVRDKSWFQSLFDERKQRPNAGHAIAERDSDEG